MGDGRKMTTNRHEEYFWDNENTLKLDFDDNWKTLCKLTKNQSGLHLKWVNFMICKLHFNKTVRKKKVSTKKTAGPDDFPVNSTNNLRKKYHQYYKNSCKE